jgi:hypothetical protein
MRVRIRFRILNTGAKDTDTCRSTAYAIVNSPYSIFILFFDAYRHRKMLVFSWKTKHDICVLYNLIARDLITPLMIRRSEVGPACEGRRFPSPDLGPIQLECHPLPSKSVAILKVIQSIFSFVPYRILLSFKLNYLLKGSVSDPDSLIPDPDPAFKFKGTSLCAKNLSDPFVYACAERCNIPVHKCPNWGVPYSFQCTEL